RRHPARGAAADDDDVPAIAARFDRLGEPPRFLERACQIDVERRISLHRDLFRIFLCNSFLPAMRTVLAVHGLAADELPDERIALVAQLLVNADLRRVVAIDRRPLGHHEERLERRLGRALVAADALENRVDLTRPEAAERRTEPRQG